MDTNNYGLLCLAVGIIIALFILIDGTLRLIRKKVYSDEFPVLTVDAVVVSKRRGVETVELFPTRQSLTIYPIRRTAEVPVYYITFAEPNGAHIELMVGEHEYETYKEQDIGRLKYQGKLFKKFEKHREQQR